MPANTSNPNQNQTTIVCDTIAKMITIIQMLRNDGITAFVKESNGVWYINIKLS